MSAQVDYKYNTLALLRAATFVETDKGKIAHCLENNTMYWITASGSGADVMTAMPSRYGEVVIPLTAFREVDANGDVGAIAANGGVLASDTTPILRGDAAESWEIVWASSNNDILETSVAVPSDFDGTLNCYVLLSTASGGTTDAATITVGTSWDGAALVTDTATGAASTTAQENTATIAAADVPDSPTRVSIQLTPAAHTTDTMTLLDAKLRYYRQSFAS